MNYDRRNKINASLEDGPVGRVLSRAWDDIHDFSYSLKQATQLYEDAAHFVGGPAERDAKAMIEQIQDVVKELQKITTSTFKDLAEAEQKFVRKYGEPSEYADKMRSEIFPR